MAKQRMTAQDFDMLRRWFRAASMTDRALDEVRYSRDVWERFDRIDSWLSDQFKRTGGVYPPCGTVEVNEDVERWARWRSVLNDDGDHERDGTDKEDRLPGGVLP